MYQMYGDDPPIPNNMSPGPFFSWRRIRAKSPEIGLMNWPRQDFAAESILDRTPADLARILQDAKRTSIAFLYWIQTDLGHPEVKLRPTSWEPPTACRNTRTSANRGACWREGRVTEQDIVDEYWPGPRARWFDDSIGIGFYMVDIHPCGANERGRMMMPKPFPDSDVRRCCRRPLINFLPAGKNIGVTHLTNGAFRLHPIEWMVGEAAGTVASLGYRQRLASRCSGRCNRPRQAGVPIVWFDDLAP